MNKNKQQGMKPGDWLKEFDQANGLGITGEAAGNVKDAIIGAYVALGLSKQDAEAKFSQLNPKF